MTRVVTLTCVPTHQFALTLTATGNGAGNVTSSPTGLACGLSAGTTCTANFLAGAQVTLVPTAQAGSRFAGWGGACAGTGNCTVAMAAATTVTAQFVATVVVHVTITEPLLCSEGSCLEYSGAHVVFDAGSQPDCRSALLFASTVTCDYVVDQGRPTINLDARVDGGANFAAFDHWDGCDVVLSTRCGDNAAGDVSVVAVYSP